MEMKIIYYLLLALVLWSCRSTRQIQTVTSKMDTTVVSPPTLAREDSAAVIAEAYTSIRQNRIHFGYFSAKIDVNYEDGEGKKTNVDAHVRIKSDSLIWVSITGPFGFEGLRALITRDSVHILDKQNKLYMVRSVSYLQELTALPLNLSSLEDLIMGNAVFFSDHITGYRKQENELTLQVQGSFFKHLLTVFLPSHALLRSKLDDTDASRNRTCFLEYDNYENKKGIRFSTRRRILVSEKKKMEARLDFKQYDFNETLSFPFSVPKNYDRN